MQKIIILSLFVVITASVHSQTAWFAAGYQGSIYHHYPAWQTKFMPYLTLNLPQ